MKKFVQERYKEMFNVQRAFLNATGPLCGLHDCIENDSAPTYEEIKVALEQGLCLLGSANTQLSMLRRQRVLAAINGSRTNLAELPLPNAKSWLFGDDFPSLASKQAELSRGQNLAQTTEKSFYRRSSQSQSKHGDTFKVPLTLQLVFFLVDFHIFKELIFEKKISKILNPGFLPSAESEGNLDYFFTYCSH